MPEMSKNDPKYLSKFISQVDDTMNLSYIFI